MLYRLSLLLAILPSAWGQFVVQSALVGTGGVWAPLHPCTCPGAGVGQGTAVAVSADGNTLISGGPGDSASGAVWIFVRSNGSWSQQGPKLSAAGAVDAAGFGYSVAISADGNTALAGGPWDNFGIGAMWVFTRANGAWTQQGGKLVGSGATGSFGLTVALSADGNTAVARGSSAGGGALWVFTRSNGAWSQQGQPFSGSGAGVGLSAALGISGDGNTIIAGGTGALIFTRSNGVWSQQGGRLMGNDSVGQGGEGWSVALSFDGNTAMVGAPDDDHFLGASWIYTRSGGVWAQQGGKLTAPHALGPLKPGLTASLSADGNTALSSVYLFTRSSGAWSLSGTLPAGRSPTTLSADARTAVAGDPDFNNGDGRVLVMGVPQAAAVSVSPAAGFGAGEVFSFTFSDAGGWQNLKVMNVLINNRLDARQACYVGLVPTSATSGFVILVDDAATGVSNPRFELPIGGFAALGNSQCEVRSPGSSFSASGNIITVNLSIAFQPALAGYRTIYMAAQDAAGSSGWQALGTWNVTGVATGLAPGGVNPARGNAAAQTFTFTFTDSNGAEDLQVTNVLFRDALDGRNACYLAFVPLTRGTGALFLVDDAGDAAGPYQGMLLPSAGTIANSQCSIAGTGSSASFLSTTLTLTLAITFSHSFAGNQVIYAAARSATANSGWQPVGTVTVP